ncbi:MAG: LamG domain-containing protein, partial [Armatimonadota bacterium]
MKRVKVLLLGIVIALLACTVNGAELAGYWSFDEDQGTVAKTSAASGYDGEIHGAKWVPGKVGSALEFNGESDYVEIKDTAKNSPFAITSMSISAWINPSAYPKGSPVFWAGIAGKAYYGESTYGLRIGSDGKVFFNVYGPFGEAGKIKSFLYGRESKTKVSLNQWHYVAVTYDNENVKFYLDGRLDSVYKENRLPEINKQSIFIGSTYAKGRYFKGIIDEVKIY